MGPVREPSSATLRRVSRRRAASLIAVHLLIGLHYAHWKLRGKTLAPLELNEVMHTLELGIVTAGFLLMATAVVSVLHFGRFFCSWGCHMLALQDLAAALLGRLGIRPVPFRSRALRSIAIGAAFYMFAWPQFAQLLANSIPATRSIVGERAAFRLRVLADGEGWASFLTTDFTRNLPGPGVALLTFVVCGFFAVWLLGTRAFCRNLCPYGAVFSLADRFARRRIVLTGDCSACGRCTAVCDSGISVYEEVTRRGAVISGDCLKDLDCIAVCPTRGLELAPHPRPGFGRRAGRAAQLGRSEEILAGIVFVAAVPALRGLYRAVPFLLAITLAACLAFAVVITVRLVGRREVRFHRWALRGGGRVTARGWIFAAATLVGSGAAAHAGLVRWYEWRSDRTWVEWKNAVASGADSRSAAQHALEALGAREKWGWLRPADLPARRAELARAIGSPELAERSLRQLAPSAPAARLDLAELLASRGRFAEAEQELRAAIAVQPDLAPAHYGLGVVLAATNREDEAIVALRRARELSPDDVEVLNNLGYLVGRIGDPAEAEALLDEARRRAPSWALPCFNLAELLGRQGRLAESDLVAAGCPGA